MGAPLHTNFGWFHWRKQISSGKQYLFLTTVLASFSFLSVQAQQELNVKFGKISSGDFQVSAPKFDTGANAVFLSDIGKTVFEANGKGFFSIVYTRFVRIKILNRNGYSAGDFEILLYNDRGGEFESIYTLKGSTFNLQNGTIQETKLDDKSVFKQRSSKVVDQVKFSMPALQPGSILDVEYTIKSSNFSDPPSWNFQKDLPCLWSEYNVTIPTFFHYLVKTAGNGQFDIKTNKTVQQNFLIRDDVDATPSAGMNVLSSSSQLRWVKKNVPAIREQAYLTTIHNYMPRISFELDYYQQSAEFDRHMEMGTWVTKSEKLLASEDFGLGLNQDNHWMDILLNDILKNTLNTEEEIKAIFHYVRNNFHCTSYYDKYIQTTLKDVFNKKTGNVAEINLLLTALLRHRNITADPALLSTRDNGYPEINLPLLYEYNYVICAAQNDGKLILLDASQANNAYGHLPSYCYNWEARAINEKMPFTISLSPDSLSETRLVTAFFYNDEKGKLSGTLTTTYGTNESFEIRNKVKEKSEKEILNAIRPTNENFVITDKKFDSLENADKALIFNCNIETTDLNSRDIIYFTPILTPLIEANPFTDAERLYPVEMTSKIDYTYLLTMNIPTGFKIDELPKSARVNYNDNEGKFEYLIQQSGESIQMRVHLKFNKANFSSDEYNTLRDFYSYVVKKEGEQIVFKKNP